MKVLLTLALLASPIIFKGARADSDPAVVRPMAKSLLNFSVKEINDYRRGQNVATYGGDFCFIEQMDKDGLVIFSRKEQESLNDGYRVSGSTFDMVTRDGFRLTVGIYEKCQKKFADDKLHGSLLIATKDGKLVWAEEFSGVLPLFLYPAKGRPLAVLSSCMECGDATELYYDPVNQRFYLIGVGD